MTTIELVILCAALAAAFMVVVKAVEALRYRKATSALEDAMNTYAHNLKQKKPHLTNKLIKKKTVRYFKRHFRHSGLFE